MARETEDRLKRGTRHPPSKGMPVEQGACWMSVCRDHSQAIEAGWRAGELVDPEALEPGLSLHCRIGRFMPGFGHLANPLR